MSGCRARAWAQATSRSPSAPGTLPRGYTRGTARPQIGLLHQLSPPGTTVGSRRTQLERQGYRNQAHPGTWSQWSPKGCKADGQRQEPFPAPHSSQNALVGRAVGIPSLNPETQSAAFYAERTGTQAAGLRMPALQSRSNPRLSSKLATAAGPFPALEQIICSWGEMRRTMMKDSVHFPCPLPSPLPCPIGGIGPGQCTFPTSKLSYQTES